jgi:hypothetical protein
MKDLWKDLGSCSIESFVLIRREKYIFRERTTQRYETSWGEHAANSSKVGSLVIFSTLVAAMGTCTLLHASRRYCDCSYSEPLIGMAGMRYKY